MSLTDRFSTLCSERQNFTLYDEAGTKLASRIFSGSGLYDIEMAGGDLNLVWVSGFAQLSVQAGAEYQRAARFER
jgi:hypothetical protein